MESQCTAHSTSPPAWFSFPPCTHSHLAKLKHTLLEALLRHKGLLPITAWVQNYFKGVVQGGSPKRRHASLLRNQSHKPADPTLLLPNQPLEPHQHKSQPQLVSCLFYGSPCTWRLQQARQDSHSFLSLAPRFLGDFFACWSRMLTVAKGEKSEIWTKAKEELDIL